MRSRQRSNSEDTETDTTAALLRRKHHGLGNDPTARILKPGLYLTPLHLGYGLGNDPTARILKQCYVFPVVA